MSLDDNETALQTTSDAVQAENETDRSQNVSEEGSAKDAQDVLEDVAFQKGKATKEIKRPEDAPEEFARAIYDVPVTIRVVLGQSSMSVEELVNLKRGEVVTLDKKVGEFADVFVNDRLIARGEVVLVDGSLGITLTELAAESVS